MDGEWRLLFKATKGSFWRWVKPEVYETMFAEEMLKTNSYIKTFSQLAEATNGSQKDKHLADKREYQELREFLLKMILCQKAKWKSAPVRRKGESKNTGKVPSDFKIVIRGRS